MAADRAMQGIPPAKNTDPEDVVWGLQTAASLWTRGEHGDAVAWLRRAAQAASDANDDDRALELARVAAELADAVLAPSSTVPPAQQPAPPPEAAEAPAQEEENTSLDAVPAPLANVDEHSPSVLPADKVHAGMFDPWADQSAKTEAPAAAPPPRNAVPAPPLAPPSAPPTALPNLEPQFDPDQDEVVTSVKPQPEALLNASRSPEISAPPPAPAVSEPPAKPRAPQPPLASRPAPPKPPPPKPQGSRKPPPLPPRAKKPAAPPSAPVIHTEPPAPPLVEQAVAPAPAPEPAPAAPEPPPPAPSDAPALDLEGVDAFSDLPDDARGEFARAATVHVLAEGEEVAGFALVYVVEGSFDVAATMVDAPAVRLGTGAVLRSRGTTSEAVPMRIISACPRGIVASWSDAAVTTAFSNCPWVEEDLRAASDRVMTLVGITIGPLGERLDQSIREEIVGRLTVRPLIPGEIIVNKGEAVPGLVLVGIGELELVDGDDVKGLVSSGDFLFATEVLGAGAAPQTARAGAGGALVMFGDRHIAQELMVTCPPLLEVFAGM